MRIEFIGKEFSPETPVFHYLSIIDYFHFIKSRNISLGRTDTWPDKTEGISFEIISQLVGDEKFDRKHYFASCWSLESDDERLYVRPKDFAEADKALKTHGSAAMWETYCKDSGVRIETTIGKICKAVERALAPAVLYCGKVCYVPSAYSNMAINEGFKNKDPIQGLFKKSTHYRHETEFRFAFRSEEEKGTRISFDVGYLFDFIDHILVSPATPENERSSRLLYRYAVDLATDPSRDRWTINQKNRKPFSSISGLYGNISHELNF